MDKTMVLSARPALTMLDYISIGERFLLILLYLAGLPWLLLRALNGTLRVEGWTSSRPIPGTAQPRSGRETATRAQIP